MPRYGMRDRTADGATIFMDFDCKKSELPTACYKCGFIADLLCDYPLNKKGKTCDRPMCTKCAHRMGDDLDYCEAHYKRQLLPERSIESLRKEWREQIINYLKNAHLKFPSTEKICKDLQLTDKECSEILLELGTERLVWRRSNKEGDLEWRWIGEKPKIRSYIEGR